MADSGGYKAGSLSLNISANTTTATKNIEKLTAKLVVLSNVLKGINGSSVLGLNSLINGMGGKGGRVGGSTGGTGGTGGGKSSASLFWGKQGVKSNSLAKFLNIGYLLSKLRLTWMMAQKIANVGKQMVQYGIDYTETLNLWQVAMRENLGLATKFVSEMNRGYGISEKTLMNTQAIYKNMIGALGNVSETVSYSLSEALVKMTLDFSSLYNVTFADAEKKMQAVLARQVRPIRSVSGYDITERTIYDLYQQMGGTKMMRQLNNTEKQLLSIYAVFKQMQTTGALGDYQKTINETANQSRMMAENWEQLMTYLGLSLKLLIDKSEILIKINALLITASEYARNFAIALGYEKPNFLSGLFNNLFEETEAVNEEIDALQGKLLGFDKFRVLGEQAGETQDISIDEKLLQSLIGYQSAFDETANKARMLANEWLTALGFQQELIYQNQEGTRLTLAEYEALTEEQQKSYFATTEWTKSTEDILGIVDKIKDSFGGIAVLLSFLAMKTHPFIATMVLIGTALTQDKELLGKVTDMFEQINKLLLPITNQIFPIIKKLLNVILTIVSAIMPIIDIVLVTVANILPTLVDLVMTTGEFISVIIAMLMPIIEVILVPILDTLEKSVVFLNSIAKVILPTIVAVMVVLMTLLLPVVGLLEVLSKIFQTINEVIVSIVTLDFSNLKNNLKDLWSDWSTGGIIDLLKDPDKTGVLETYFSNKLKFANGGIPDRGTLFYAGEAGAELVASNGNGQSGVMNMQQLQNAVAKGMINAISVSSGGNKNEVIEIQIGEETLITAVRKGANRRGLDLAPMTR